MKQPRVNGTAVTMIVLVVASLWGCVTVQVEPYVLEPFPPRPGQSPVPLEGEPARPHVKIARLIATSSSADDDRMQGKILSYAGRMGADAVVMGQSDVIESTGLGQSYQSTNAAGTGNSLFGGMGSGMPFFFDPWTYVQAPVDRVEYINYLSGIAIRYQDAPKVLQLCSQSLEPFNVLLQYASGASLPAASLDGLFEHPVGHGNRSNCADPLTGLRISSSQIFQAQSSWAE